MRRIVLPLFMMMAVSLPALASADLKVGYVDLQRALNEVKEGKAAKARLEARIKKSQAQIEKEEAALKARQEQLQQKRLAMDEATLRSQVEELEREMMRYSNTAAQLQREVAEEERKATQDIFARMRAIISQIAEKEELDYVLELNESGILHAPPAADYTNELVRLYDAKHKGK